MDLLAWAVWLKQKAVQIGSTAGQVDCLITGKLKPLREKLLSLLSVYGAKMTANVHAVSSGVVSGVRRAAAVVPKELAPTARVVGVARARL